MKRKPKKVKQQSLDPNKVIAGKIPVTALELIRLIHQVNPTPLELESTAAASRYTIKSRLQSLLLRNFRDSVVVRQDDPKNPHIISIKLKLFEEDACHACIWDLDEDVSSRIMLFRDADSRELCDFRAEKISSRVSDPPDPREKPADGVPADAVTSSRELLKMGIDALEAFDYDLAKRCFTRAFTLAGGSLETALQLITFYVDYLAAYQPTLDLRASMPGAVRRDPDICRYLALAAARSGQMDDALDLLTGVPGSRPGEVYCLAFRHYLNQDCLDQAQTCINLLRHCDDAREVCDPAALQRELLEKKEQKLNVIEIQIQTAWDQGCVEEAVELANQILIQRPQSRNARQILDQFNKQQQQMQYNDLVQAAAFARKQQDWAEEYRLLRSTIDTGCSDEPVRERLLELQQLLKAKKDAADLQAVQDLWRQNQIDSAFLGFLGLREDLRAEVKRRIPDIRFSWVEQAVSIFTGVMPEDLTQAVNTLLRCRDALAQNLPPDRVIAGLKPHESNLRRVPDFWDALNDAQKRQLQIETAQIEQHLQRMEQSLTQNDSETALEMKECLEKASLMPEHRKQYDQCVRRLEKLQNYRNQKTQFNKNLTQRNLFLARELAERLMADPHDPEPDIWKRQIGEITETIDRDWALTQLEMKILPGCVESLGLRLDTEDDSCCLADDGNTIYIFSTHQNWVVIREFSFLDQLYHRVTVFKAPVEMSCCDCFVDESAIWITGCDADVIQLTQDPIQVRAFFSLKSIVKEGFVIDDHLFCPDEETLWLQLDNRDLPESSFCAICDIRSKRILKKLPTISLCKKIHYGTHQAVFLHSRDEEKMIIYSSKGDVVDEVSNAPERLCDAATIHPNRKDLILLSSGKGLSDEDEILLEVNDSKGNRVQYKIKDSNGMSYYCVVTSLNTGLFFIRYHSRNPDLENQVMLDAYRPTAGGCERLYSIAIPKNSKLITDRKSKIAVLVYERDHGVKSVLLDQIPPVIKPGTGPTFCDYFFPSLSALEFCNKVPTDLKSKISATVELFHQLDFKSFKSRIRQVKQRSDPEELSVWMFAFYDLLLFKEYGDLKQWLLKVQPDYYIARMLQAEVLLENRKYEDARDQLAWFNFSELSDKPHAHCCHLLGIACLGLGDIGKAMNLWEEGAKLTDGECNFEPLLDYGEFCELIPEEWEEEIDDPDVIRVLKSFQAFDQLLDSNQWQSGVDLWNEMPATYCSNMQFLARAARAFLNLEVLPDEAAWLSKVVTLSELYNKVTILKYCSNTILPPSLRNYSNEDILDLAAQAEKWLENTGS